MRGSRLSFIGLAIVLGACAAGNVPSGVPGESVATLPTATPLITTSAESQSAAFPSPSPSAEAPTFCPFGGLPPKDSGGIPGLTARPLDRATVEIANSSERSYFYRISGWELKQYGPCRSWDERDLQEGPIAPGETVRAELMELSLKLEVPITIVFWKRPCVLENCQRDPIAAIEVERSAVEPLST